MAQDTSALERSHRTRPRSVARSTASPDRVERGAAVVEAALTLPVVFMLIFGMITGGMALGQKNAIENSAREASRFGATLEVTSSTQDWLDAVSGVAISAATGDLDAGTEGRYICVALVGTSNADDGRIVVTDGAPAYAVGASADTCPGMTCPPNRPCVQVSLKRTASLDLIATSRSLTLDASSVSTFERN